MHPLSHSVTFKQQGPPAAQVNTGPSVSLRPRTAGLRQPAWTCLEGVHRVCAHMCVWVHACTHKCVCLQTEHELVTDRCSCDFWPALGCLHVRNGNWTEWSAWTQKAQAWPCANRADMWPHTWFSGAASQLDVGTLTRCQVTVPDSHRALRD